MTQLDAIGRRQRGAVTRPQALQHGLSPTDLHELIRAGHWQRLLPGIYATFTGRPPPATMRWAAVLYSGAGAMLCHRSAAEETGLATTVPGVIHILIPENRRVRPHPAMAVHRSRHAASRRDPRRRPPQTRVEDTVLDLASLATDAEEARRWITTACTRRLTTPDRLADALTRRPRLIRRHEIAALLAGAISRTAGLPPWPPA
ncbi:type IV toxin-antitoxin system AbiEi family antitoxin domain-containing protein [Actinoplanes sp. NPDC020271]|uniref:type IV toxin-antitoxin system AbiEi family antitoxin domain-containing protein n=1 Tax=Actinoplanes sp. NPDC020271 TaxID=3363896 RepID=UPI0037A9B841